MFCFFKQKTAYELRISDWSSDVCSSDLSRTPRDLGCHDPGRSPAVGRARTNRRLNGRRHHPQLRSPASSADRFLQAPTFSACTRSGSAGSRKRSRSEEHTSELQSLMRISYAVFCLKKKHI